MTTETESNFRFPFCSRCLMIPGEESEGLTVVAPPSDALLNIHDSVKFSWTYENVCFCM